MENLPHKQKRERLTLKPKYEGLRVGTRSDGSDYSVRDDRRRYFFPQEWEKFIDTVNNKEHRFFFITLLHTGARIMEALNLKHEDIDAERSTVKFTLVKQRKAKKNTTGKSRGFFVSNEFIKEYKSFIRNKTINPKEFIFLDNSRLPSEYGTYDNSQRKKFYISKVVSYSMMLKRHIKSVGIKDYYNFSPHNIRKTYGMWMRTFNIEMGELCYRMGHDIDTFISNYGSSLIFTDSERRHIQKIMGDVK